MKTLSAFCSCMHVYVYICVYFYVSACLLIYIFGT